MTKPNPNYSAEVTLWLQVGTRTLSVAQVTPHECILRETADFPPGPAEIIMHLNDHEHRWPVVLRDAVQGGSERVRFGS